MTSKTCRECKCEKPISEFYKHPQMPDGTLNHCKKCKREYAEKNRLRKMQCPEWAAKEMERQRLKRMNRAVKFPEKQIAHNACRILDKPENKHLHHWSYLPEHRTDIFVMDIKDHRTVHCYMEYDQERMQYRRVDTMELLDTREKAELFYNTLLKQ